MFAIYTHIAYIEYGKKIDNFPDAVSHFESYGNRIKKSRFKQRREIKEEEDDCRVIIIGAKMLSHYRRRSSYYSLIIEVFRQFI